MKRRLVIDLYLCLVVTAVAIGTLAVIYRWFANDRELREFSAKYDEEERIARRTSSGTAS